jgi:hypothetical protein
MCQCKSVATSCQTMAGVAGSPWSCFAAHALCRESPGVRRTSATNLVVAMRRTRVIPSSPSGFPPYLHVLFSPKKALEPKKGRRPPKAQHSAIGAVDPNQAILFADV